jgi:hypothetical protein
MAVDEGIFMLREKLPGIVFHKVSLKAKLK